jgi:cytochrome c
VAVALACTAMVCALTTPEERGKDLFARRCSGCHALDRNKEGPRLGGVFGRKAASLTDFEYSEALRKSGIEWNEANLERWLRDPDAMAPGTDMAFRVADASEREALIAYLKSLNTVR